MATAVKRQTDNWTYVLEADRERPEGEQSRFTLRPLGMLERAIVFDGLSSIKANPDGTKETIQHRRRASLSIALNSIVSIENFPAGEPQAWPDDVAARRSYLNQLQDPDVDEIANEVWEKSAPQQAPTAPAFVEA